jgi:hypothetical protein
MPIEFEYIEESPNEDLDEEEIEDEDIDEDEEEIEEDEEIEEEMESNIEEIEFGLSNEEIEKWISELIKLKEEKENIGLQIDNDLFLKINYVEEEEE